MAGHHGLELSRHFMLFATVFVMTAASWVTGVSAGLTNSVINRPVRFISFASGLVDAANASLWKSTAFECGLECRNSRICSAFSVSNQQAIGPSGSMGFQCLFTFGEFTWTPNQNFSLFVEDVGPPGGYILATDGKFYKYYSDALSVRNARAACMLEGGNFAVPHPMSVRLIIWSTIPVLGDYFMGMIQGVNNVTNSTWLTDDGASFNSSNKLDPDQAWRPNEPSNSGVQAVMDSNGTWNDVAPNALMSRMCRKFNYYTGSPVTGRYHKVHYELLDAAGAAAACALEGATLANVYGQGVYESITKYRRQLRTISGSSARLRRFCRFFWSVEQMRPLKAFGFCLTVLSWTRPKPQLIPSRSGHATTTLPQKIASL